MFLMLAMFIVFGEGVKFGVWSFIINTLEDWATYSSIQLLYLRKQSFRGKI